MEEGPVEPGRAVMGNTSSSLPEPRPVRRLDSVKLEPENYKERGPLGLTTLHEPKNQAVADLIFVHGLGGGSQSTWSLDNGQHFWPKDWLSQDDTIKDARIHTFGYASSLNNNMAFSVSDIAQSLLRDMLDRSTIGRTSSGQDTTPIIFVGHSMGGIVIKKAYLLAREHSEFMAILERLHAVVFLATPHRGADMAGILTSLLVSSGGQKSHITNLVRASPLLQEINENFRHVSDGIRLFSFHETRPSFFGTRQSRLIVDKVQSSLGYPSESCQSLDADHRSMSKFSTPHDANYVQIRNVLASLLEDQALRLREVLEQQKRLIAVMKYLGVPNTHSDRILTQNQVRVQGSAAWLLELDSFQSWRDTSQSTALWLRGQPGSGKTFVAGAVVNHLRKLGKDCCCFFFEFPGNSRSTTLGGFMRSMLMQMALLHPEILAGLITLSQEDDGLHALDDEEFLRQIEISRIYNFIFPGQQYWVIDGLDECKEPLSLMFYLRTLCLQWPLKIFVTARDTHEPHRTLTETRPKLRLKTISMETQSHDLDLYLRANTQFLTGLRHEEREGIIRMMTLQANGSILWAQLVTKALQQMHTAKDMMKALEDTPTSLDALYRRTLEGTSRSNTGRGAAQTILAWATYSMRPLSSGELQTAISIEMNGYIIPDIERVVSAVCVDLAYIDNAKRLQLVHVTLKKFFIYSNPTGITLNQEDANLYLANICLKRLLRQEYPYPPVNRSGRDTEKQRTREVDALWLYAYDHLFDHVNRVSKYDNVLLRQMAQFCQSHVAYAWIEHMANTSRLSALLRGGHAIIEFLKNREGKEITTVITDEEKNLGQWARDLVHLVEAFSEDLSSPSLSVRQLMVQVRTHREKTALDDSDSGSSVMSLATENDSLRSVSATTSPSSVPQDQTQAATLFIANSFAEDADLQHLYSTACNKLGRGKFLRNNRRLLRELNQNLRPEATGSMQGQVVRFLGSRRIRTTISHHILQTFETASTVSISALLRSKNDQIVDINRWLGNFDDGKMTVSSGGEVEVPHAVDAGSDDGNSNASSDNSFQDDEEVIYNKTDSEMTPHLAHMIEFIISGPAFAAYKKNLRAFIEPNATHVSCKPPKSDNGRDDVDLDKINDTDEESLCRVEKDEGSIDESPDEKGTPQADSSGTDTLLREATLLSKLEFCLRSILQPPSPGYERVSFVCGCGKLTFIDVRELAPGGISRFRDEVRKACERVAAAPHTAESARQTNYPTPPAQVHLATGDVSAPMFDDTHGRPRGTHVEAVTHGEECAREEYPQTQQYLLLCINTRRFRVLRHVDIEPLMDDEEFFRRIRNKYEETRRSHEWKLLLLLPGLLASACSVLAHKLPMFTPKWVIQCFHWDSWPGLEVIKRGIPVRFDLVPRRPEHLPEQLKQGHWPPKEEVPVNYVYHPVSPPDVQIKDVPGHWFTPGGHMYAWWLRRLAKKQRERLDLGSEPNDGVVGYGLLIEERLSGRFVMLSLFLALLLTAVAISVYSKYTGDNSSALALGAFLAAVLVVFPSYHFLTWKESG